MPDAAYAKTLRSDPLSPLCSPAPEHLSAANGAHPRAEAMSFLPFSVVRLECPFHRFMYLSPVSV